MILKKGVLFLLTLAGFLTSSCMNSQMLYQSHTSPYCAKSDLDKMVVKVIAGYNFRMEKTVYPKDRYQPIAFFPGTENVSSGSGLYISQDGLIVTNRHVVEGRDAVLVRSSFDEKFIPARVLYIDSRYDLAFIYTGEETEHYFDVSNVDKEEPQKGSSFFIVGYPLDQRQKEPSVTKGVFSRKVSMQAKGGILYQTDASANPGNSGGPVFDSGGNLVGIIFSKKAGLNVEGYSLAVPAYEVVNRIEKIREKEPPDDNYKNFAKTLVWQFEGKPAMIIIAKLQEKCEKNENADVCMALSAALWNRYALTYSAGEYELSDNLRLFSYHYFFKADNIGYKRRNNFVSRMEVVENEIRDIYVAVEQKGIFRSVLWRFKEPSLEKEKTLCLKGNKYHCYLFAQQLYKRRYYNSQYESLSFDIFGWLNNLGLVYPEFIILTAEKIFENYDVYFSAGRAEELFDTRMESLLSLLSAIAEKDKTVKVEKYYLELLKNGVSGVSPIEIEKLECSEKFRLLGHIQLLNKMNPRGSYMEYIKSASSKTEQADRIRRLWYEVNLFQKRYQEKEFAIEMIKKELQNWISAI